MGALALSPSRALAGPCHFSTATACNGGGANDICTLSGTTVSCDLEANTGTYGGNLIGVTVGNVWEIWGNDEAGNEFCCVWNPEDVLIVLGTPQGDNVGAHFVDSSGPTPYNLLYADIYVYGDAGPDDIVGADTDLSNDYLHGEDGSDTIHGYTGYDHLYGENDTDYLYGGAQDDVLNGGDGVDYLRGEDGAIDGGGDTSVDYIKGGYGIDTMYGNGGADQICGGPGIDYLTGNDGDDILFGDLGLDVYYPGNGTDHCEAGAGCEDDTVTTCPW